eukprot:TRINITY_DN7967_c0_g2_i2.p6 TRINITY_DN7967_c0_g2~~TRINITY_DN7967_c0_g2_i2.p6  ORF type:complete len:103 (-),score=0.02 TRINITY_DN7967_c0_g2_i2:148-456(-)
MYFSKYRWNLIWSTFLFGQMNIVYGKFVCMQSSFLEILAIFNYQNQNLQICFFTMGGFFLEEVVVIWLVFIQFNAQYNIIINFQFVCGEIKFSYNPLFVKVM